MSTNTEKRLKIAFMNQPLGTMSLPVRAGSISIWTYEIARRLAQSCEVIVYARRGGSQKTVEHYKRVQYRRLSVAVDKVGLRLLKRSARFRNAERPYFSSSKTLCRSQ